MLLRDPNAFSELMTRAGLGMENAA